MKRIIIDNQKISEGMLVAKDVFSMDGTLLIPAKTRLTANHIVKINVYNISRIDIFVEDDYKEDQSEYRDIEAEDAALLPKDKAIYINDKRDRLLTETKEFIEFNMKYESQVNKVEDELRSIVLSGDIEPESLNSIVNDIMETSSTQNQLFSYMCRLKNADDITFAHSMNVSLLSSILGKWLGLSVVTVRELAIAGLLHDIGKVRVNQSILNKKEKLTDEEFNHLKQHTTLGYELVAAADLPLGIKHAILMHHEKMNGAGYPLGLSWDRIHDYAKIVSIVDIYDAMTAERPYHKRFHPFHVIKMFEEECYGILDTKILYVFLERIAHNFLDDKVRLNNGAEGKIIFIHHRTPSKPIIQLKGGRIIDLLNIPDLAIEEFL